LLIACSNLANLQLARAAARRREIAIRTALGATQWQLLRQGLAEGLILGLTGGGLGLMMAIWGKDFLLQLAPADFPLASSVAIDPLVLSFCAAVSLCVGVAVGLAPALHGLKSDANEFLHAGTRTAGADRRGTSGRNILIIAEIALSLILLIAAGLVIKSFAQLQSVDPGFAVDRAIVVRLSLPAKYSSGAAIETLFDKLSLRLEAIPGIDSVTAASALPMSGLTARTEFLIAGRPPAKPSEVPAAYHQWVSAKYFAAMGIRVHRGRGFVEQDNEHGAGVVVVDQELVRRFFGNQNPIGAHIFVTMGDNLPPPEYEVVGVAENVKRMDLSEDAIPTFYGPIAQAPKSAVPFAANNLSVVMRTRIDPGALASTVRSELRQIDSAAAVSGVKPLREFLAESVAARKFSLILLAAFAGTALVLAASGLYAVIAYLVTQRTREIGVRLALGAQRSDVLSLIMGHGLRLVVFGIMGGLLGAFLATRSISALLFHTSSADPGTYATVALLLAAVALLASYLPARRAMKVDPIIALRAE
jgi:predicted permease